MQGALGLREDKLVHEAAVAGEAWARTPAKPLSKSSGRISGTSLAAAAASARRLTAWRMESGDSAAVRLHLTNLGGREASQSRHVVLPTAPVELVEAPKLALVTRNNQLSDALVREATLPQNA